MYFLEIHLSNRKKAALKERIDEMNEMFKQNRGQKWSSRMFYHNQRASFYEQYAKLEAPEEIEDEEQKEKKRHIAAKEAKLEEARARAEAAEQAAKAAEAAMARAQAETEAAEARQRVIEEAIVARETALAHAEATRREEDERRMMMLEDVNVNEKVVPRGNEINIEDIAWELNTSKENFKKITREFGSTLRHLWQKEHPGERFVKEKSYRVSVGKKIDVYIYYERDLPLAKEAYQQTLAHYKLVFSAMRLARM